VTDLSLAGQSEITHTRPILTMERRTLLWTINRMKKTLREIHREIRLPKAQRDRGTWAYLTMDSSPRTATKTHKSTLISSNHNVWERISTRKTIAMRT
jgi:hypothetical protein